MSRKYLKIHNQFSVPLFKHPRWPKQINGQFADEHLADSQHYSKINCEYSPTSLFWLFIFDWTRLRCWKSPFQRVPFSTPHPHFIALNGHTRVKLVLPTFFFHSYYWQSNGGGLAFLFVCILNRSRLASYADKNSKQCRQTPICQLIICDWSLTNR